MIINRLDDVKEEMDCLVATGRLPEDFEGTFYPRLVDNRIILRVDGLELYEGIPERILESQGVLRSGSDLDGALIVGRVSDITYERERIGEQIAGPGPMFTDEL